MTERMWARSFGEVSPSSGPYTQRVDWSITGSASTPMPSDLRPTAVLGFGTGRLAATKDAGDLVRSAGTYVAAIAAVLPTSDAGNDLVDELLRQGTQGLAVRRPLTRRTK